jgi:hypothetical protein
VFVSVGLNLFRQRGFPRTNVFVHCTTATSPSVAMRPPPFSWRDGREEVAIPKIICAPKYRRAPHAHVTVFAIPHVTKIFFWRSSSASNEKLFISTICFSIDARPLRTHQVSVAWFPSFENGQAEGSSREIKHYSETLDPETCRWTLEAKPQFWNYQTRQGFGAASSAT